MKAIVISGGGSMGAFAGGVVDYLITQENKDYELYVSSSTGTLVQLIASTGNIKKLKSGYTTVNNKDIWMDSDEVIARLNLINELYSEDNEEEGDNMFDDFDDDFIEEEEEVKPKKCCGKLDDR